MTAGQEAPDMSPPLRILFVEDSEADTRLLVRELHAVGYDLSWERVETLDAMHEALARESWDMILADYAMPHFSGDAALALAREMQPEVPFLIVSGVIIEEKAIVMLKAGARDVIYKGNLARLIPAVQRELQEQKIRRARRRAEDALRESEERFRVMADGAPAIMWVTDTTGGVVFVNRQYRDFFGVTLEQVSGGQWQPLVCPDDATVYLDTFRCAVRDHGPFKAEARVMRADGEWRWVASHGEPRFAPNGDFLGHGGISLDITERKEEEERSRIYDAALQQALDAIIITDAELDAPGPHILMVNAAFTEITGYAPEEVVGNTPRILQGPKTERAVLDRLREQLTRGEAFFGSTINYRKDGSEFVMEWRISPIRDARGAITHFVATQRDITARKQSEVALRESEARFASAFQYAAIGMALVAPDGRWLKVNQSLCAIVGYAEAELLTKTFQDITHPEDLDTDLTYVHQLLTGEITTYQMEKRYVHKMGHVVWVLLSVSLVKDSQDAPQYFISQIDDITARKQAEAHVQQLLRHQEDLLHIVSHDLRTPLAIIHGHMELLEEGLHERGIDSELTLNTSTIDRNVQRMRTLIQDLVDMARIESHQFSLKLEDVTLQSYVPDLLVRILDTLPVSRITTDIPADLPPVRADYSRLERIILNLLTNAFKYSASKTLVHIQASRHDDEIVITVADHGRGINPQELPHLFERYFRAMGERQVEGIGLGLYITKQLVEAHDGRIWVESAVGKGSTFFFTLPIGQPAEKE